MKYLILVFIMFKAHANNIETVLLQIAEKEAYIANIGKNKLSMLYGTKNPIPIINRWNNLQNREPLTKEQIQKINALEHKKQLFLKQITK